MHAAARSFDHSAGRWKLAGIKTNAEELRQRL
jgi:hypothetical protein